MYTSQTGFIKERSILDNIFVFWEAVAVAKKTKQDLAILLLDFEKAYDRVDWSFLEGTMVCMGFSRKWVKAVSALYSNASSKVIINGSKGESFKLSRSVRQGCPLAPFLFLFFAEAMSSYLSAEDTGIQGLCLSNTSGDLLDSEFADDTTLYVHGSSNNLKRVEKALDTFCLGSGAKLNWKKTVAFWVSDLPLPGWLPHPKFEWVPEGQAVKYLGCHVGINIAPELQIAPLLHAMRKKLMYWSTKQLSVAGRVVIANQVLLSSMWYITSCWIFVKSSITQIQRLIRNFLWSGSEDGHVRSKVAWATLIKPRELGGLGLIDPESQSKALLVKLMIRGHLPGNARWKELLKNRILDIMPKTGGPWMKDCRWNFLPDFQSITSKGLEDRFFNSLCRAWQQIKMALRYKSIVSEEGLHRQPVLWNPSFRSASGKMIGSRTKVAWGPLEKEVGCTYAEWRDFLCLPENEKSSRLAKYKGGSIMYREIQRGLYPYEARQMEHKEDGWFGMFSSVQVLLGARAILRDGSVLFFNVLHEGKLERTLREDDVLQWASPKRVRVIVNMDRQWHIDPSPEEFKPEWNVWVYKQAPLVRLQWDPGDYSWRDPFIPEKEHSFFQYTVKLGRHIVMANKEAPPAAARFWASQNIEEQFLGQFWKKLWNMEQARKITIFHWLLVHRSLAVKEWLKLPNVSTLCTECSLASESLRHALWDCTRAKLVWQRVLRIFHYQRFHINVSWGSAVWITLTDKVFKYDSSLGRTVGLDTSNHGVRQVPIESMQPNVDSKVKSDLWNLVSSSTLWYIWKARCQRLLGRLIIPIEEVLKSIWQEMVLTMRARFDAIVGDSDSALARRQAFLAHWKNLGFFEISGANIRWIMAPPRWLFPP